MSDSQELVGIFRYLSFLPVLPITIGHLVKIQGLHGVPSGANRVVNMLLIEAVINNWVL